LAEQQRHLFCKQAQTGAAPVAGSFRPTTRRSFMESSTNR
jgi:hypothetical protein